MIRTLPLLLILVAACTEASNSPAAVEPAPAPPPGTPVTGKPGSPAAAPGGFRPSADCPIHGPGEWSAHINAMPGPGATPTLIVTGTIAVKPAARAELRLDPAVLESEPPQRIVNLVVRLPREPTIDSLTRREVRGEWPVTPPIGAIHIRCGGRSVASISDIVVAH